MAELVGEGRGNSGQIDSKGQLARFVCIFAKGESYGIAPSSRRQATVRRTVAFDGSNLSIVQKKSPSFRMGFSSGAASQI